MIDLLQMKPTQVIERLTIVTPLGLRFWDQVTEKIIGDGLIVTAYPPDNPSRTTSAFVNRSSTYVLRNLPGLKRAEIGEGDDEYWGNLPVTRTFTIDVRDSERRFQPFTLSLQAPQRGIVKWPDQLVPDLPGIPLYSSTSRKVPAAVAVIRAELREWKAEGDHLGEAAAWAVIEASLDGREVARGYADERGRIALIFPYPDPVTDAMDSPPYSSLSPPGAAPALLKGQQWAIELTARYARLRPEPPMRNIQPVPDLTEVFSQPPAILYANSQLDRLLDLETLHFGQELILRSRNSEGESLPVLFITPAGSPP
jgi:hypothetical protein